MLQLAHVTCPAAGLAASDSREQCMFYRPLPGRYYVKLIEPQVVTAQEHEWPLVCVIP